jgi:hypothetical protein
MARKLSSGIALRYNKGWRLKMFINGFGALCTAIVMVVFAVTKFREGAWIVLILTPVLVTLFFTIHHHYKDLASHLTLDKFSGLPARRTRHRVILPVSGIHQGALEALRYAKLLSDDVTAIHVSSIPETEKVRRNGKPGERARLIILDSPFRLLSSLYSSILEILDNRQPNETVTIVVPQFIPSKHWQSALHMPADFLVRIIQTWGRRHDVHQVREETKE